MSNLVTPSTDGGAAAASAAPAPAAAAPTPSPAPSPTSSPTSSPAPAPAVTDAAPSLGAASPSPAPAAAPTPADGAPATPGPEKVTPHTDTPSLLSIEKKSDAAKSGDAAKPGEEPKPGDEAASADAAIVQTPKIVYEAFKLPDGVRTDPEAMTQATELFGTMGLKQDQAQSLIDRHAAEMQKYATQLSQHLFSEQHRVFGETRRGWIDKIKSDPEIGGSAFDTVSKAAAEMRDLFVTADHTKEWNEFVNTTGAGDHPAFVRLLNNVAKRFREPHAMAAPSKPAPDAGKPPGGRRASLYDHATSKKRAGG